MQIVARNAVSVYTSFYAHQQCFFFQCQNFCLLFVCVCVFFLTVFSVFELRQCETFLSLVRWPLYFHICRLKLYCLCHAISIMHTNKIGRK
jgi:hypothetical protein